MTAGRSVGDAASDPRFQRSLEALLDAVTGLLDREPVAAISITRLVEAAGVSRPTFYRHFPDMAAAAQRAAIVRLAGAFPYPEPAAGAAPGPADTLSRSERQALPVLEHLQAHRAFYLRVLEAGGTAVFFDELVSFVADRLLPDHFEPAARRGTAERRDLMTVLAGGVMWLVIRWLRDGAAAEPPAGMARRVAATAASLLRGAE